MYLKYIIHISSMGNKKMYHGDVHIQHSYFMRLDENINP